MAEAVFAPKNFHPCMDYRISIREIILVWLNVELFFSVDIRDVYLFKRVQENYYLVSGTGFDIGIDNVFIDGLNFGTEKERLIA